MATETTQAMARATRVVGNEESKDKGGKSDGDGDEEGDGNGNNMGNGDGKEGE